MSEEFLDMSPESIEQLSPDEAKGKIDQTMQAATGDPSHAYSDGHHPGHKKAVSLMQQLHQRAAPPAELQTDAEGKTLVSQFSPEATKAMQEGMDILEGKHEATQAKLVAEAEVEMAQLVKLGFDEDSIPADIKPYQVRGLKEQRLLAEATDKHNEDSWNKLGLMLAEDFKGLSGNTAGRGMVDTFFRESNPSDKLATEIAHVITKHIWNLKKGGQENGT